MTFSRIVGGPLQIPPKTLNPNDIRISGSRVCKLWSETCPAIGTTTPSVASVPASMADWAGGNLGVGAISGSPEQIRGTTDNSRHYVYHADPTNDISSYSDITLVCTAVGAQQWIRVWSGARYCNFDVANGAVGNKTATESGSTVTVAAGVATVTLKSRTVGACNARVELLGSDDANATPSNYVSSASDGINVSAVSLTQIRASAQNNLARADDGSLIDPTGGVQTTTANQPLILDQDGNFYTGASGQIPVVSREAGRVPFLSYVDSDVVGVVNGDDPAFAVAGLCKLSGAGAAPLAWYGTGSAADIPFRINGTNLESHRHDGTTGSTKTLGTNLAASVGSWTSFAFLRHADRSCQLYLAGALVATITHDDLASLTATSLQTGPVTVTTPAQYSLACMAWAGDLTYDAIRPALLAACARYPGLGLVA